MVVFWILLIVIDSESNFFTLFSFILVTFGIATFVLSIVSLVRVKEKALAITALVLSSILGALVFAGIVIVMIGADL